MIELAVLNGRVLSKRFRKIKVMANKHKVDLASDANKSSEAKNPKDSPQFGRLLLVLVSAVALIVVITFATEAYYTP